MKRLALALSISVMMSANGAITPARADTEPSLGDAAISSMQIDEPPKHTSSSYDQLLTFQLSQFKPQSLQISNGAYSFDYGNQVSSLFGEAGWAVKVLDTRGSFYLEENLAFSSFSGNAAESQDLQLSDSSYSLYLFGLDTRLMYAADWFPWKSLIPFVDGGYQYTIYYQPASSGLESAQGGVGNLVGGAGLRLWLNRGSSLGEGSSPIFLSAKLNRILPSSSGVNLASTSVLGGFSIGL